MAQAVVDEANVGAPALIANDGVKFVLAALGIPEFLEVTSEIAKISELAAQLASPHITVEVNDNGRSAGGAGHRPRVG